MAKPPATNAVAGWVRKYPLAPRYQREEHLELRTADGVRLRGARLPGPADAPLAAVVVHGFSNWSRNPRIHGFARALAQHLHVIVPDLRGHGRSGGRCTLGIDEPLDVAAAVAAAPDGLPVVTIGVSMGGAAAIRHAGSVVGAGSVAGVVAVSAPAWWATGSGPGAVRVRRYIGSPAGRVLLSTVLRTRVSAACESIPDPVDCVAAVAPAFLVLVHDPDDWYFGREHAEALFEQARPPKAIWWEPGGGHGTDLLTPSLAGRVAAELTSRVRAPSP